VIIDILEAGDRLAHQLCYPEYRDVLDAWWKARHEEAAGCTVCTPTPPTINRAVTVVLNDTTGECVAVTATDSEHRILKVLWEKPK